MTILTALQQFEFGGAFCSLWVFKGPRRNSDTQEVSYTGRWVAISEDAEEALRSLVVEAVNRTEEILQYDLLTENHSTSALELPTDETHSQTIVEISSERHESKRTKKVKDLVNTSFYAIRFDLDGESLIALSRTNSNWTAKKKKSLENLIFTDDTLDVDKRVAFDFSKTVDLIIYQNSALLLSKSKAETILHYRAAHENEFTDLTSEKEFVESFEDIGPLTNYVGTNKIRLRRMSALRQKGNYKKTQFMANLRAKCAQKKLKIEFNASGKIIVTPDNAGDVITALLDHRLISGFSDGVFDVQSASPV